MSKISLKDTRETFKNFFKKNNHHVVESGSLIPNNDPTLMFTNSGMVQFKNVFTGVEKRDFKTATTAQKCVRAGGKHNDLENVGYTPRHHTFFEMLGNFSFGDYFKEEAIFFAWNLITKEFGISKDKLCMTVYSEDDEAFNLWKKITGFNENKIIKISTSDNFWSMGDTGPCGPCSEIFYDHGEKLKGGPPGSKDQDGDRFIEIWNLVFMQFEQVTKDKRINLPKPSVDTGMGLERMTAVLQGTHDNYEIDLFKKLIDASAEITKSPVSNKTIASHRVISDHLRAACFLIADGLMPSNEGRGYVLRRIMRRGMRHAETLGGKSNTLSSLINALISQMSSEYNELSRAKELITETIMNEEDKFSTMLNKGMKVLNNDLSDVKNNTLSGDIAFKLYDTFGFPLDLTQDYLKPKNINVDVERFNKLMDLRKEEARKSWKGSGSKEISKIWFELKDKNGPTEFVGYNNEKTEGKIIEIIIKDKPVKELLENQEGIIITNQTCFYAEAGGQVGDIGLIKSHNSIFEVSDTQKYFGDFYLHYGKVKEGKINSNQTAVLIVDKEHRNNVKANHSATHLLQAALRETLGKHVAQKGSYVGPERLRFDFSHNKAIQKEEINKINLEVNEIIKQNENVSTRLMSPTKAIKEGAMALFGEKYGEEARVVSMGRKKEKVYSLELCGGTHVNKTGEIGKFEIISEGSIASGVRRIEGLRGEELQNYTKQQKSKDEKQSKDLKDKFDKIIETIKEQGGKADKFKNYLTDMDIAEKYLSQIIKDNILKDKSKNIVNNFKKNNITFRLQKIIDLPGKELRSIVDETKKQKNLIIFLFGISKNKISIAVGVSDDLTEKFDASEYVKYLSKNLGGSGGGGRKDFAQAGGTDVDKIDQVVKLLIEKI
ncbi:MAG: alanine--tRNA ligase [Candidatus Pelagibacter sp.]|nr:alanine--tRNA ligase [Candidatus Pelagibacter sp.]MAJ57984.1 alanine--tRNA ligase [Candidatus Pelagibacter sp.]|tara:strand:- start:38542 stop:41205 length:2664 start_codon:yes stop_codon:yes gene_type:complete